MSRAQVLALVSDGTASLEELVKETQLPVDDTRAALDWLLQNGLVGSQPDANGVERLLLTEDARDALEES